MKTKTWVQSRWERLRTAHRAGLPALSVARARELVARHPDCGPAWKLLGSALIELARYEEAESAIRRAIALCPTARLWIPLAEMGHLHKARGDHQEAASWYRRAVDAAPDEAGAHIYLGGLLAQSGSLDEAEAAHRAATRCENGCRDEAFLNLGLVLRALGRHDEAAGCFEAALQIDPRYRSAKLALRDVRQTLRIKPPRRRTKAARESGGLRTSEAAARSGRFED
ncbi:tetratricopeptide repeat protein [Planctomyces sp. SH-PL62]|uniref:tetratricopeptide repeat protein n=1 Tax=Planctomyces sp. SH-PL62 TaxID=1636152 RepID=UPI00078C2DA3|nr:tetratricopeptide repeat protein [Planctomyces sp. SH-PL62]AMV36305.1 Tetratricopeptide repeat protein [Planctomyces sp. SH-PL62]